MKPMLATAIANAPVGVSVHKTYKGRTVMPGFAKRSVKRRVRSAKDKGVVLADIGVLSEAYYVLTFVGLGTSRFQPQPWLVPAFRANKSQALASYRKSLQRRILNTAKKK